MKMRFVRHFTMRYAADDPKQMQLADNEVLCTRMMSGPTSFPEDLRRLVEERIAELKEQDRYEEAVAKTDVEFVYKQVTGQAIKELQVASPYERLQWRFDRLPKPSGEGTSAGSGGS